MYKMTTLEIKKLIEEQHFPLSEQDSLLKVSKDFQEALKIEVFSESQLLIPDVTFNTFETVVITLGKAIDELQNKLLMEEKLLEAYFIDCLSNAYLLKLYPLIMQRIENKQQLYVEKIIFLGEDFKMSLLDNIFDALKITSIKYNNEYMLEPKKTVVFFLPLIKEKNRNRYHICATCNKKECYMRNVSNLTYGYQQIYGGNGCVK